MALIDRRGLDLSRIDPELLKKHENFSSVVMEAILSGGGPVEPSHFLLALLKDPEGYTPRKFREKDLDPRSLEDSIRGILAGRRVPGQPVQMEKLDSNSVSARSGEMFSTLDQALGQSGSDRWDERHLLHAVLQHLEEDIKKALSRYAGIDVQDMARRIGLEIADPGKSAGCFDPDTGLLDKKAFDRKGWRVMELAAREAEGYGVERIDSLILLLALVGLEDGVTQRGLRVQGLSPMSLHQNICLNLRARRGKGGTAVPLKKSSFFESTLRVLERAAREAAGLGGAVGEGHLLRSFLQEAGGMGLNILKEFKADKEALHLYAGEFYEEDREDHLEKKLLTFGEIEDRINQQIVGQEEVLKKMMPFIKRVRFGYPREGKTAGVFLFVGPPGVGKTQTAKLLAEAVYGSGEDIIVIEMGHMGTSESRSLLIGAPPGYVGYGEGKLTNGLRDKPNSVVLFDEMEKAHPLVFDVLLRFLNEGKIDDPAGPERDGQHCIVVLTSNLPVAYSNPSALDEIIGSLRKYPPFKDRPELLSRVDSVLPFRALEEGDYREIAVRQVKRDALRLKKEKEIDLIVGEEVFDLISRRSLARNQGARAVEREVIELVITPLIDLLGAPRPAKIRISCDGEKTLCEEIY